MKITSLIRKLKETQKHFGKDLEIVFQVNIPETGTFLEAKPGDIVMTVNACGEEKYEIKGKVISVYESY